ncbi:hypothetical protein [Bradyrhizobium sp. USDA 377]
MRIVHHRESQRCHRQDAEAGRMGAAANAAKGCVNRQGAAVRQPTGRERKASAGDRNDGRTRSRVGFGGELAQFDASSAGDVEYGVVEKPDPDLRIRSRFDYVMAADKVANIDLRGRAIIAREGNVSQRALNDADDLEGKSPSDPILGSNAKRN